MGRGVLVCFTGIDGAGKTTLAKKLAGSLKREGIKAEYVYARYIPWLLKPFMLLGERLFLRGLDPFADYAAYSRTKKRATRQRSFLSFAYQVLLMADYLLQILVKVGLPTLRGRNVICDRYVYDTLINDLAIDFSYSRQRLDTALDWWMRVLPKPCLVVLVDVPEEVAYHRKSDIPSIDYVKERRPLYKHMAQRLGMFVLDGLEEPGKLHTLAYAEVLRYLGNNSSMPRSSTGNSTGMHNPGQNSLEKL